MTDFKQNDKNNKEFTDGDLNAELNTQADKLNALDESLISDGVVSDSDDMALDDERRIKVLSPGALVRRRFIRNRLAIIGLAILVVMFLFSYLGGLLSPYGERQQFKTERPLFKNYAGVTDNTDLRYVLAEGSSFDRSAQAQFIKAYGSRKDSFTSGENPFTIEKLSDKSYLIHASDAVAHGIVSGMINKLQGVGEFEVTDEFSKEVAKAVKANEEKFTFDDAEFTIRKGKGKEVIVGRPGITAVASTQVLNFNTSDIEESLEFRVALEKAIAAGESSFSVDDVTYAIESESEKTYTITKDGERFAVLSDYIVQPVIGSEFLDLEYKDIVLEAVENGDTEFTVNEDGEDVTYKLERKNIKWDISREYSTVVYNKYDFPSSQHWLGTDQNGMDLLTRLMYGGRISLMVGFIVVLIAMTIGVLMGGISGFFGGWVDMLIMRLVDIFYCIPSMPILIILGSIMDQMDMESTQRMIVLMMVLGFLSWAGVARMVRGQILSLREQEYMVAAEATGLSYKRRILKHLIPNVMPLLIVSATMSLGSTILTESALSFLGLGVKYPYASWGNIINAVSNQHVMTQYPFVWIPAGILIVLTVVAFNFVGDGLRDAYDPKMKR